MSIDTSAASERDRIARLETELAAMKRRARRLALLAVTVAGVYVVAQWGPVLYAAVADSFVFSTQDAGGVASRSRLVIPTGANSVTARIDTDPNAGGPYTTNLQITPTSNQLVLGGGSLTGAQSGAGDTSSLANTTKYTIVSATQPVANQTLTIPDAGALTGGAVTEAFVLLDGAGNTSGATTGTSLSLTATALTTGTVLSVGSTAAGATGNLVSLTSSATGGTSLLITSSATTGTGENITANSLTSGTGLNISTNNGATFTGNLVNLSASSASAAGTTLSVSNSGTGYSAIFAGGRMRLPIINVAAGGAEPSSPSNGDLYGGYFNGGAGINFGVRVYDGGVSAWRGLGAQSLLSVHDAAATAIPLPNFINTWTNIITQINTTLGQANTATVTTSVPGIYVGIVNVPAFSVAQNYVVRMRDSTGAGATRAMSGNGSSSTTRATNTFVMVYIKTTTSSETLGLQWASSSTTPPSATQVTLQGQILDTVDVDLIRLGN